MSPPNLNALIYARVSTSHHEQKPEVQIAELRRYCTARGWQIAEEIIDHGYSGGTDQRPGLKTVLALVRSKKVDVVVVTKLDRLARSLRHLVTMLDEFSNLQVQFVSIGDQIDLGSAAGRLMLHIVAAFSEFERALIRERTMAGLAHARSKGRILGRPKERDDIRILEMRKLGMSYRTIAKKIGCSRASVYRAIQSGTNTP